ncbi:MAG: hypothetical protein WD844_06480 [Thermoleophilaceae bacterium]
MSVLVIDLKAPGVTVRPIRLLTDEHHFNEVILDEVEVGDEMLLGECGSGWQLITSELSLERSGPERFLSTFPLFAALVGALGPQTTERGHVAVGRLAAHLWALRQLTLSVASTIDGGRDPVAEGGPREGSRHPLRT